MLEMLQQQDVKLDKQVQLFILALDIFKYLSQLVSAPYKYYEYILHLLPNIKNKVLRLSVMTCLDLMKLENIKIGAECLGYVKQLCAYKQGVISQSAIDYETVLAVSYKLCQELIPIKKAFNLKELELILLTYFTLDEENELSVKLAIQSAVDSVFKSIADQLLE